ncbi:APC amino acid permease [Gymnopilus junonius]|uniref:APC amino acid permease n=1 Tax=Gymnopilus junonius TaxID=109634 RepID=A0A9P5TKG1_GYMJU|nr:APC amino acid permease [Gymnopilus junonius]
MKSVSSKDTDPKATAAVVVHPTISVDGDTEVLAGLGYKQEFRRNFTPIELFGIAFSIIGLVPSLASVLVFGLPYGGTSAIVWGWAVCGVFLTSIALAIAELGSAAPTSGGLYYWTFKFSSPRWRRLLCWIVGYSNTTGNIAAVASVDWGCAVQITAAASIGSGLTFEATTAQTYGVCCALLLCHVAICSLNPKIIARLQMPYIILNVLLCLVFLIGLPAATPKEFMNDAKFVFGTFQNVTSWNDGWAFLLSFLYALWTIGAFDSTIHISEEARNANVAIPFALIASSVISIIIGWGLNVAMAFCMGTDIENILSSPIGQPMATILFNSFGQKGTLAVWSGIIVVQFALGTSILTASSRQVFAFSRDGGLPLSTVLYKINERTHAPTRCVWFTATVAGLLGLLAFAGSNAIGAVFTLAVVCQYIVYSIPISARFLGGQEVKPGPFELGKLSLPIAIIAVLFMTFFIIVFLFPASPNPGAGDMNYTVVVLGGALLLSIVYYFFPKYGGRYWFTGPVRTLEAEVEVPSRGPSEDEGEKS